MGKLLLRKLSSLLFVLALAGMVGLLAGCEGDDGAPGAIGADGTDGTDGLSAYELAVQNGTFTGTLEEWLLQEAGVESEACATCHTGDPIRSGQAHQDFYDDLFQLGVITVTNVQYMSALGDADGDPATPDVLSDIVTFQMTKKEANFDCTMADSLNIYFTEYTGVNDMEFTSIDDGTGTDRDGDRLSIKATKLVYDGAGGCTSTKAQSARGDLAVINGIIAVYGQDEEIVPVKPENVVLFDDAHISLARFPFGTIIETGAPGGVDYVSAANASGCEKCHISPYFKHGYIVGDVGQGVGDLDFYTCKACHIDNGSGGHQAWQLMVDNPQKWADYFLQAEASPEDKDPEDFMTAAELAKYAYKTRLMNDVHMSHAMEFPYPQSMANCATCHSGKLAQTLTDENFVIDTCKSCHPVTGGTDTADADGNFAIDTTGMALENIMPDFVNAHDPANWGATACNACHTTGGIGPVFSVIHTSYDPIRYDEATKTKYSTAITASIDSVSVSGNIIDIKISATGSAGDYDATQIIPRVNVSFYGYNTKDFIVSNHSSYDVVGLEGVSARMEKTIGVDNPLFTEVDADGSDGTWEVTLDMALLGRVPSIAEDIAAGVIKKAEVAFLPYLPHNTITDEAFGMVFPTPLALNAVTKTIDVTADAADATIDNYFKGTNALVSEQGITSKGEVVTKGCDSCHDTLTPPFHGSLGAVGGSIVACRMCHVVTEGGSHLEGQSRSIDSYLHAIHSFQAFDVDRIDFTDPVEAAHYQEHVNFLFPDFAIVNCMACHKAERAIDGLYRAAFDIPDQSYSMPGLLSATDEIPGVIPLTTREVVTGPAARACGGCHRARFINQNNAGGFASFNQHTKQNGYRVEKDPDDDTLLYAIISFIMGMFQ